MTILNIKTFLASAIVASGLMLAAAPALAQGGDDPIEGIDIIIKLDPSGDPIKPFSLTGAEMKQINALDNIDRPALTLKLIAKRIDAREGFVEAGMKAFEEQGCPPKSWQYCGDPEVFSVGEVTYTLDLAFRK